MNEIGDIVYRTNIKFKDSGTIDTRIVGHPTVNITYPINDHIYYITMTTSYKILYKGMKYLPLNLGKLPRMTNKFSYVNLNYIYKTPIMNEVETTTLNDTLLKRIYKSILANKEQIKENHKNKYPVPSTHVIRTGGRAELTEQEVDLGVIYGNKNCFHLVEPENRFKNKIKHRNKIIELQEEESKIPFTTDITEGELDMVFHRIEMAIEELDKI